MGKQRIEVSVSFEIDFDDEAALKEVDDTLISANEERVRQAFSDACDLIGADGVGTSITTTSLVVNGETWDV
jgi:hypothetical protein